MGGARRYPFPKWVWTPYGGWWSNPKPAPMKFAAVAFTYVGVCAWVYQKGEAHTIVYRKADNSVTFPATDARSVKQDAYYQWKASQQEK